MARIFARTWVYVGHESEVARPGDFKTTTIGRQPVVLVRQPDGTLAVLFNRCSHRASTVCLERRGSAHHFRCPYHGWTFRLDGSLIGATYGDGYDEDDLDGPDFALGRIPRVGNYRGFVFASLARRGPLAAATTWATRRTTWICSATCPPPAASSSASPASTTTATRGTGSCSPRTGSTATTRTSCTAPTWRASCPTAAAPPCSPRPPRGRPPTSVTATPSSTPDRSWPTATSSRRWPPPPVGPTSKPSPTAWARPGPGRSSAPTAVSASTCWSSRTSCSSRCRSGWCNPAGWTGPRWSCTRRCSKAPPRR